MGPPLVSIVVGWAVALSNNLKQPESAGSLLLEHRTTPPVVTTFQELCCVAQAKWCASDLLAMVTASRPAHCAHPFTPPLDTPDHMFCTLPCHN